MKTLGKLPAPCYNLLMPVIPFHCTGSAYPQVIAWRTQAEMIIIRSLFAIRKAAGEPSHLIHHIAG